VIRAAGRSDLVGGWRVVLPRRILANDWRVAHGDGAVGPVLDLGFDFDRRVTRTGGGGLARIVGLLGVRRDGRVLGLVFDEAVPTRRIRGRAESGRGGIRRTDSRVEGHVLVMITR